MRVSVVNLGCKVNRVESDTIAAAYQRRGAELSEVASADVVVVNTCTVTEEADKKTRKAVRRVLRQNDHADVLVTGCAAAIHPAFFEELDPRITVVDKHDLFDQEDHTYSDAATSSSALSPEALEAGAQLRVGADFPTRVSIKVQDGCNHACTYCIVHVARGRAWSRPADAIVDEALSLAGKGVKELVLSGIDLGSYAYWHQSDGSVAAIAASSALAPRKPVTLVALLTRLLDELERAGHADVRLRIGSIEPCSVQDGLIDLLAQAQGRICRHLHVPLQSGSTKVLKEMNRPYTASQFLDLVTKLRQRVGDVSLTTDVIVGFPGETDGDFEQTCQVVEQVGFSKVHVFRYSRRQGTPAAARPDQIDAQVKEKRAHQLIALSNDLHARYVARNRCRLERIVVEKRGWGMSESYYKVHLDEAYEPGSVIEACLPAVDEEGVVTL